jgi:lipopolysaccharide export LptBFGC system permease protein LptF
MIPIHPFYSFFGVFFVCLFFALVVVFLLSKISKLFDAKIYQISAYVMMVILSVPDDGYFERT